VGYSRSSFALLPPPHSHISLRTLRFQLYFPSPPVPPPPPFLSFYFSSFLLLDALFFHWRTLPSLSEGTLVDFPPSGLYHCPIPPPLWFHPFLLPLGEILPVPKPRPNCRTVHPFISASSPLLCRHPTVSLVSTSSWPGIWSPPMTDFGLLNLLPFRLFHFPRSILECDLQRSDTDGTLGRRSQPPFFFPL